MKKILLTLIAVITMSASAFAQANSDRITLGMGVMYENSLDATLAWEEDGTNYQVQLLLLSHGSMKPSTIMHGSSL